MGYSFHDPGGCCCAPPDYTCDYCEDNDAPEQIDVTLSGIGFYSVGYDCDSADCSSINDTYTLTQASAGSCTWSYVWDRSPDSCLTELTFTLMLMYSGAPLYTWFLRVQDTSGVPQTLGDYYLDVGVSAPDCQNLDETLPVGPYYNHDGCTSQGSSARIQSV